MVTHIAGCVPDTAMTTEKLNKINPSAKKKRKNGLVLKTRLGNLFALMTTTVIAKIHIAIVPTLIIIRKAYKKELVSTSI